MKMRDWIMNAKVYPVIIGVSVCLFVSCVFQAASNLGLSPKKEEFEIFSSAKISRVSISYLYTPKDFPPQEIRFTLRDKATIARLQSLFKIKSLEPYTLGVNSKIEFAYFDEKNRYDGWSIDFKWKRELLFAHDNWKAKRSCSVVLNDDSFYDAVFELAWENNKHLFPTSSKSEVSLCF